VDFCCFQAFRPVISWAGVRFWWEYVSKISN
jgi:hypothetical protein